MSSPPNTPTVKEPPEDTFVNEPPNNTPLISSRRIQTNMDGVTSIVTQQPTRRELEECERLPKKWSSDVCDCFSDENTCKYVSIIQVK